MHQNNHVVYLNQINNSESNNRDIDSPDLFNINLNPNNESSNTTSSKFFFYFGKTPKII